MREIISDEQAEKARMLATELRRLWGDELMTGRAQALMQAATITDLIAGLSVSLEPTIVWDGSRATARFHVQSEDGDKP